MSFGSCDGASCPGHPSFIAPAVVVIRSVPTIVAFVQGPTFSHCTTSIDPIDRKRFLQYLHLYMHGLPVYMGSVIIFIYFHIICMVQFKCTMYVAVITKTAIIYVIF